jgi:hypothetical protein
MKPELTRSPVQMVKSNTENRIGAHSHARRIWLRMKSTLDTKLGRTLQISLSWRHEKLDGRKTSGVQILDQ